MRRIGLAAALVALTSLATAGIATATHRHNLITPGTTVVDVARGQTAKCAADPGGHQFHNSVHFGTPGTFAFAQGGQVHVIMTENASC